MEKRLLELAAVALLLLCGSSCAMAQGLDPGAPPPQARAAEPVVEPAATAPAPAPAQAAKAPGQAPEVQPAKAAATLPSYAAVRPVAPAPTPDIELGTPTSALTEALDKALERLAKADAENQWLKEAIAAFEKALGEKEQGVKELEAQVQQAEARVQQLEVALEKWKQDVLGFRNEMRDYEEAQIEVLQEIVVLLRGLKKARTGGMNAEEPS